MERRADRSAAVFVVPLRQVMQELQFLAQFELLLGPTRLLVRREPYEADEPIRVSWELVSAVVASDSTRLAAWQFEAAGN